MSQAKPDKAATTKIGNAGESFVADLLATRGWQILALRWRCRWGELDIVACDRHSLIFVEVKTRSPGNWDGNGILAITPQKQAKIRQAALEFLGINPNLSQLDCRFDVAIVQRSNAAKPPRLRLLTYIAAAFSASD